MLVLPLPMIIALVLAFLFLRNISRRRGQPFLLVLLVACAVQSVITSLVQYYGITALRWLQPVTASLIPAIVWVAFIESCLRVQTRIRDYLHLLVPVLVITCIFLVPMAIDALLIMLFTGYGIAILTMLHVMKDDLAHTRLSAGHLPATIWRVIAVALIISAGGDALISLSLAYGFVAFPGWILSISSSVALLVIGYLCLSHDIETNYDTADTASTARTPQTTATTPTVQTDQHAKIMHQLAALLDRDPLYLDPDLTLARLSRKMGLPLKQLSTAINAVTGENVSRYINGYRVRHACSLLLQGQNVTTAMLDSGFNTKSNFNREFLRIIGKPPGEWQQNGQNAQKT